MSRSVAVGDSIRIDGKVYRVVDIVREGVSHQNYFHKHCEGTVYAIVREVVNSHKAQPLFLVDIAMADKMVRRMKRELTKNPPEMEV